MIKRGQIYFIRSNKKEEGTEQYANRPAVIVSNDKNNEHSSVYEIVYMTTKPKADLPTHFITNSALTKSTVLCEQINSVYKERIGEWIGELTQKEIEQLDKCLAISIGTELTESNKEVETLQQRVEETKERQKVAEKKAQTYKEMYEFLLRKQLGEVERSK